jgi:hypothetical protein
MQEYLPIMKATLLEWVQLALANPLYTAALVVTTALLVAMIGMIKSIPLKRRAAASEKARVDLSNNLSLTQQQATGLQERLVQRNRQVADTVQALTSGFDLGEQPLPAMSEDLVSDDLWQQHDRMITALANRLRAEQQAKAELQQSYQAETGKRAEKEAMIDSLQNTLAEKNLQISGQEQQIAQILEKHAAQSARLTELEQQAQEWADAKNQNGLLEERLAAKEAELNLLKMQAEARKEAEAVQPAHAAPLEKAEPIQPQIHAEPIEEAVPIQPPIHAEPVKEQAPAQPQIQAQTDQALRMAPPATEAHDSHQTIVLPDWDYEPEAFVPPKTSAQPSSPAPESSGGITGKFKNLFSKPKPEPIATEEKAAETTSADAKAQTEKMPEEPSSPGVAQSRIGKVKNLFGLAKQEVSDAEAKPAESETREAAPLPEPAGAGESSAGSAKKQIKKIKNLFSTAK